MTWMGLKWSSLVRERRRKALCRNAGDRYFALIGQSDDMIRIRIM